MPLPYSRKILYIDLEKKKSRVDELSDVLYKKFIGGSGLAAWLFFNLVDFNKDAFDSSNPLIFMTGPLTGTLTPSSGRHAVVARSPLTNLFGESTTGGFWGTELKKAGYDGLVIIGKSDNPVYLYINDEDISFRDATHVWGKNYYETMDILLDETDKKAKVTAIGVAGEKLVRFAAIMNDHGRAAGRTGLGAVMGSKNLKAIVVKGSKEIKVFSDKFIEYNEEKISEIRESTGTEMFRSYGTAFYMDLGYQMGDIPAKYYREGEFPAEEISGITLVEKFDVEPIACYACPIACGRLVRKNSKKIDGPEYETLVMLGAQNMVFDLDKIVEANHLCNDYGLDTISTGAVISFAFFLYEQGKLSEKDIGFKLEWGDGDSVVELVRMIGERRGIGDILAKGIMRAAEKFGIDQEYAAHVKGLEIPAHDPRAFYGQAISYATSNRGADHLRGDFYLVDLGAFEDEDLGILSGDRFDVLDRIDQIVKMQNLREVFNSLAICIFPGFTSREISDYLKYAVGWNVSPSDINLIGERIFNLKRIINNLYGSKREDDKLPKIVLEPYKNGNIAGMTPVNIMEKGIEIYYNIRGWDKKTGRPKKETLVKLDLIEAIEKLNNLDFW